MDRIFIFGKMQAPLILSYLEPVYLKVFLQFCAHFYAFMSKETPHKPGELCYDEFEKNYNSNTLLARLIAAAGASSTLNQIL